MVLRLANCPEDTTRPSMVKSWKIRPGSLVRSLAEMSSRRVPDSMHNLRFIKE